LNRGKHTAGTDGNTITTSSEKLRLAKTLQINGKANTIRRVWIPKPGKKEKRPLGIPTIQDRAKQALCKMVLEPEWEAQFEPNSYGFRPGRRCHDAIEAIWGVKVLKVNTLNRKGKYQRTRNSNRIGQRPHTKRAIVTLAAGSKIPLFES
jgi:RNA-directed DNA polymerase